MILIFSFFFHSSSFCFLDLPLLAAFFFRLVAHRLLAIPLTKRKKIRNVGTPMPQLCNTTPFAALPFFPHDLRFPICPLFFFRRADSLYDLLLGRFIRVFFLVACSHVSRIFCACNHVFPFPRLTIISIRYKAFVYRGWLLAFSFFASETFSSPTGWATLPTAPTPSGPILTCRLISAPLFALERSFIGVCRNCYLSFNVYYSHSSVFAPIFSPPPKTSSCAWALTFGFNRRAR